MKSVRKWWLPLLLGALLTALLMGAAAATPTQQPQAAKATKELTISMAEFRPYYDSAYSPSPHYKRGSCLLSMVHHGPLTFVAPVQFPHAGLVTVEKLELIGRDANSDCQAQLYLMRANPYKADTTKRAVAGIRTGDDWAGGEHVWSTSSVSPRYITTGHNAWLKLTLTDDTDLAVYGVRIYYHKGK
jgi:hypothetical protein